MESKTYRFKEGQKLDLDAICDVQGLRVGAWWWEPVDGSSGEQVIIMRDITINIRIWQRGA